MYNKEIQILRKPRGLPVIHQIKSDDNTFKDSSLDMLED